MGAASAQGVSERPEFFPSPDGKRKIEVVLAPGAAGDANTWRIALSEKGKVLWRRTSNARYIKVSWSPSSRIVLTGENQKASMDLRVLQIDGGAVRDTGFDSDSLIDAKLFATLPWREQLKSIAPVARVTWKTVKWIEHPFQWCTMTYILRGIGYEGEADLLIDLDAAKPALRITAIRPTVHPGFFDED